MLRIVGLSLALILAVGACTGDQGPTGPSGPQGPAGPQGPMGPAGASVAYQVFEGPISATTMNTILVNTGGVFPGIVCYFTHTTTPGAWALLNTDTFAGTSCGVIQSGSSYFGQPVFPVSFVNSGYTLRIILFWLP